MTISVVINTKNAAKTLERTLRSVKFANQIIIVDMYSDDDTLAIAKKYSGEVYLHADVGYVEPARNFAIKQATGEWILVLDADEVVPESLAQALESIAQGTFSVVADCYYLPRKNNIFEQYIKYSGWWPDYVLRFFKKGFVSWNSQIHSVPITKGVVAELPAQDAFALTHYNYSTIEQYIQKLQVYTTIQAQEKIESPQIGKKQQYPDTISAFSKEFFSRLFAQQGIKDREHGLLLAFLQGFSEVVVDAKAWQHEQFVPTQSRKQSSEKTLIQLENFKQELSYWIADTRVKQTTGIVQWYWRLRRKISV